MLAFNSKGRYGKSVVTVHVLQNTQNLVISRCCFAEDGQEMYQCWKRTCRTIVLLIRTFCLKTFSFGSPSWFCCILTLRSIKAPSTLGRRNLKTEVSLWKPRNVFCGHTTPKEFKNAALNHFLGLCLRKTRSGKSHDYRDAKVFESSVWIQLSESSVSVTD